MVTNKISIDKEELEALRKELGDLRNKYSALQLSADTGADLSQKEKDVLSYVSTHPGAIKERVIEELTGTGLGSRVTILKAINELTKYGLVNVRKQKPNSQIHNLFVNQDSMLVSLVSTLDQFETLFPTLVQKIKSSLITKEGFPSKISEKQVILFNDLFLIYQQFIAMIVLHAISTWPKIVKDSMILTRLYAILFSRLNKIQLKLSEALTFGTDQIPVTPTMVLGWFVLRPEYIQSTLGLAKEYNAIKETEDVFDVVWKVSHPFFRWARPHFEKTHPKEGHGLEEWQPKDWRDALIYWQKQ